MAVLCLVYLVCSLRTNLIFFLILLPLPGAFSCLAGAFWFKVDDPTYSQTLTIAGGALAFVTCMFGWYLFIALMLASIDAPFNLPGTCASVFERDGC